MFAKVFAQIFDSSISEDYIVRHVFMDLLVLADREGIVDMTLTAISRRTNVPPEIIQNAIDKLLLPDPTSRSDSHEGCRIAPLDNHRDWGWYIVNFSKYRDMRDEEARKSYFREYQRVRRAKDKAVKDRALTSVDKSDKVELLNDVTHTEAEVISDADKSKELKLSERPEEFANVWNRNRGHLPKVDSFSDSRRKKVQARMRGGVDLARFTAAVDCCRTKPFLAGEATGWVATFDWLIQNDLNIEKAINNPYAGNGGSNGSHQNGNGSGKSNGSPTKQRVDAARSKLAEIAIQRGLVDSLSGNGHSDSPLPIAGSGAVDRGVSEGSRSIGVEILAPEGFKKRSRHYALSRGKADLFPEA